MANWTVKTIGVGEQDLGRTENRRLDRLHRPCTSSYGSRSQAVRYCRPGWNGLCLSGIGISPEDSASETLLKFLTSDGVNYHSSKGPLFPFLALVMERDFMDRVKLHAHSHTDVLDPAIDDRATDGDRKSKSLRDFPAGRGPQRKLL